MRPRVGKRELCVLRLTPVHRNRQRIVIEPAAIVDVVQHRNARIKIICRVYRRRVRAHLCATLIENVIGIGARRWLQVIVHASKELDPVIPQISNVKRGLAVDLLLDRKVRLLGVWSSQVRIGKGYIAGAAGKIWRLQQVTRKSRSRLVAADKENSLLDSAVALLQADDAG